MTIQTRKLAIKSAIEAANVTPTPTVYADVPDSKFRTPAIFVRVESGSYQFTMGTLMPIVFAVTIMVQRVDLVKAQEVLDAYLDPNGLLVAALRALSSDTQVIGFRAYGGALFDPNTYMGAEIMVRQVVS